MSVPKNRPERKPLARRNRLAAAVKPGYVRRWVNEEHGAVERYLAAGWALVSGADEDTSDKRAGDASQTGTVTRTVVNKKPGSTAKTAVLMEIPEEWYYEDFKAKQAELDKVDDILRRSVINSDPSLYNSRPNNY